jgi:hypothetical protein
LLTPTSVGALAVMPFGYYGFSFLRNCQAIVVNTEITNNSIFGSAAGLYRSFI